MNKKTATVTAALALAASSVIVPNSADAANKIRFGSELNATIQPSNSVPGLQCDQNDPTVECTFVMNEAYGRPDGGELAPIKGTLKKVRVISGAAGSFQLQLVKAKEVNGVWQAKVKAHGPMINLIGQDDSNWDTDNYKVEVFTVNMDIKKGWRLAMKATSTSAVRCSSGGDNTLIFTPPLESSQGYRPTTSDDGCWPLIEGVVKP